MSRSHCSCARRPGSSAASTRWLNRHLDAATLRAAERPGSDEISETDPNEIERPGGLHRDRVQASRGSPSGPVPTCPGAHEAQRFSLVCDRTHALPRRGIKADDACVGRVVCKRRVSRPHCSPCAPHSDEYGPSGGSLGQPGRGSVASRGRTACVAPLRRRSSGAASNSARHLRTRSSSFSCTDSDVVRIELFRSSGASSSRQMMC